MESSVKEVPEPHPSNGYRDLTVCDNPVPA